MNAPEANSGSRPVWKRGFFIAILRTGRIGRIAEYPSAAYLQSRLAYTPFDEYLIASNMADALRLYGRFGEAARLYAAVLQHFPELEDARANYAICLAAIDRASD